ncbi:MAG: hypothetical protein ACOC9Z_02930 [Chloroflexota bacterium]
MQTSSRYSWTVVFLMLIVFALFPRARVAQAHGDDLRTVIEDVPVASNSLTVWVSPSTPRPGELHVVSAATDEGAPVMDYQILVNAVRLNGDEPPIAAVAKPATQASGYRQEAILTIPREGHYRFTITVRDPDGNSGQQQFDLFVRPVSIWMNVLIYVQLLLAPFIGLWLLHEGVLLWRTVARNFTRHKVKP